MNFGLFFREIENEFICFVKNLSPVQGKHRANVTCTFSLHSEFHCAKRFAFFPTNVQSISFNLRVKTAESI